MRSLCMMLVAVAAIGCNSPADTNEVSQPLEEDDGGTPVTPPDPIPAPPLHVTSCEDHSYFNTPSIRLFDKPDWGGSHICLVGLGTIQLKDLPRSLCSRSTCFTVSWSQAVRSFLLLYAGVQFDGPHASATLAPDSGSQNQVNAIIQSATQLSVFSDPRFIAQ